MGSGKPGSGAQLSFDFSDLPLLVTDPAKIKSKGPETRFV